MEPPTGRCQSLRRVEKHRVQFGRTSIPNRIPGSALLFYISVPRTEATQAASRNHELLNADVFTIILLVVDIGSASSIISITEPEDEDQRAVKSR